MTIRNCCLEPKLLRMMGNEDHGLYAIESTYKGDTKTLAIADGKIEAEQAKRAFEQVLLPRFTRDEAIAIVKAALAVDETPGVSCTYDLHAGIRLALEALASAGVFVDECCGDSECKSARKTMAAKLDAAGIR